MWSLIFCLRRRHEPAERLPRLIWSASNGFKSHLKTGLNPRWRFFFSDQNRTQLPFSGSFLWPLCVRPLTLCGVKTAQSALPESPAVPPEPRSWGRCTPTPAAAPPSYKHKVIMLDYFLHSPTTINSPLTNFHPQKRKYCAEQIKSLTDGLGSEQTEQ